MLGSGLFGMPPIPDLGQPLTMTSSSPLARPTNDPPVLFGKPSSTTSTASGLFGTAKQQNATQVIKTAKQQNATQVIKTAEQRRSEHRISD